MSYQNQSRSLRGNVDRNKNLKGEGGGGSGRSLRGNVDRNDAQTLRLILQTGRSLRGNVDRNSFAPGRHKTRPVVPYVGTWIEMSIRSIRSTR